MKIFAVIPSSGSGTRINAPLPKQYVKFNGKELIAYTLQVFQNCELIDEIIISAQREYFNLLDSVKQKHGFNKITAVIEGGVERQHSVYNAIKSIRADKDDLIVIHDAVRPLLPSRVLSNAITTAVEFSSAVVAIKAKDTLAKGLNEVESYIDRTDVYYIQTPQIFRYDILLDAMIRADQENFVGTDESILVKRSGMKINLVEGSSLNFKITTDDDITLFEQISLKIN